MKKLVFALLLWSAAGCVLAAQHGDFTYETNGPNAEITGYTGAGGNIGIPGSIDGLPVLIGENAFRNCTSLVQVVISNGVVGIGERAFDTCSLRNVLIPASVNDIQDRAFADCANLTNIVVEAGSANYCSTNGVLFDDDKSTLVQCPGGITGHYMMPPSVTTVGNSAFRYCRNLTGVTISPGLREIESAGFYGCFSLVEMALPDSLQTIRFAAFASCRSLTNISIFANVTVIEELSFISCDSLRAIEVVSSNANFCSVEGVLYNKAQTTLMQYPGGKPGSYTLPASVSSIAERAFISSYGLTNIWVDAANPWYSSLDGALCNKDGTTLLQCPGGKRGAFAVPPGVSDIGPRAFAGCDNLVRVTIPAGVTNIQERAFEDGSFAGIYFHGNAPAIDGDIFDGCGDNLVVYILPETLGWGATFANYPTATWPPEVQTAGWSSPGGAFGFQAGWVTGMTVVMESSVGLANQEWIPLQTNTFTNAVIHFDDSHWADYPNRFYRMRQVP